MIWLSRSQRRSTHFQLRIVTLDNASSSLNHSMRVCDQWKVKMIIKILKRLKTTSTCNWRISIFVLFQLNSNILLIPIAIAIINIAKDLFLVLLYFVLHYLYTNINLSAGHCRFIFINSFILKIILSNKHLTFSIQKVKANNS